MLPLSPWGSRLHMFASTPGLAVVDFVCFLMQAKGDS